MLALCSVVLDLLEQQKVTNSMESIVILGLGNILYGDEAFGVRVAEQLYLRYDYPDNIDIIDAGTLGQTLLQFVEKADRLLILDAVDFNLPPGTLIFKNNEEIPAYLTAHKMSLHQTSFSEVIALANLKQCLPKEMVLIGVQPISLEYGTSLTQKIFDTLDKAVELTLEQLKKWNITPQPAKTQKIFQDSSISLQNFNL